MLDKDIPIRRKVGGYLIPTNVRTVLESGEDEKSETINREILCELISGADTMLQNLYNKFSSSLLQAMAHDHVGMRYYSYITNTNISQ